MIDDIESCKTNFKTILSSIYIMSLRYKIKVDMEGINSLKVFINSIIQKSWLIILLIKKLNVFDYCKIDVMEIFNFEST